MIDTDENGWPYAFMLGFSTVELIAVFSIIDNTFLALLISFISMVVIAQCCLFLSIVFSKTLKPISLYKKLVFSLCPILYFSS